MKLSSLLSAAVFSLLASFLAAQSNSLEFSYSGSDAVRGIENSLLYRLTPLRASLLEISGLTSSEQRLNFSQKSRHSQLNLALSLDRSVLRHSFVSGYDFLYDSSTLEENFLPYRNKTGFLGYSLAYSPADSLTLEAGVNGFLRTEEDRYLLGHILDSEGLQYLAKVRGGGSLWGMDAGLGADFDLKRLDWEYYRSASLDAYLNYPGERLALANRFDYNRRNDNLYVLNSDTADGGRGHYTLYDRQNRSSLLYSGVLDYSPWDNLHVSLQDNYTRRITDLEQNIVRNNADYINQASLDLRFQPWERVSVNARADHSYAIKAFNFTENSRITENRNVATNLGWEYASGDTLSAGFSVDLQQTSFPDDKHRWDNDTRNVRLSLANVHYWHERIKLTNRVSWDLADDVYLDGILSDNNKQTSSLAYQPECGILIGDRMLFNQAYTVRADYTDFMYESSNKAFYRQLGAQFKLVFDSYPYVARSNDLRWMLLPYRNKGESAFLTDLSFGYERNEYADYDGTQYLINYKNTSYTAAVTFKHDIGDLYWILQPKYMWGTWKEYNLLLGCAWKFTSNSLLEFSLNPVGEDLENLDWRTSVSLGAHF